MRISKMRISRILLLTTLLSLGLACSPRDFLTRRLAADLISTSDAFKAPQLFWLRTGVVSNKDFSSPEFLVLQSRGWIIGTERKCSEGIAPPPCWDVELTPHGVDTVKPLISSASPDNVSITLQVAHRELLTVSGISKAGNFADVEFIWHW